MLVSTVLTRNALFSAHPIIRIQLVDCIVILERALPYDALEKAGSHQFISQFHGIVQVPSQSVGGHPLDSLGAKETMRIPAKVDNPLSDFHPFSEYYGKATDCRGVLVCEMSSDTPLMALTQDRPWSIVLFAIARKCNESIDLFRLLEHVPTPERESQVGNAPRSDKF